MRRTFSVRTAFLFFAALGCGSTIQAAVIAGNFGGTPAFDPNSGYAVLGANQSRFSTPGPHQAAVPFTPASSALLGQVLIPLADLATSGGSTLSVSIQSDSGGVPSGVIVEAILVTNIPARSQVVVINSGANPLLVAGTKYWLVATAGTPDSQIEWNINNTSDAGAWAQFEGISWAPSPTGTRRPAFQITDTGGFGPLTIVSSAVVPSGSVGSSYSQALAAGGGTPPYNWALVSGALPTGLSLSNAGVITGIPAIAGVFNFRLSVTDLVSSSVAQTFTLTIVPFSLDFTSALRISQVIDGGNWKTRFILINLDTAPISYASRFWSDDGSSLSLPILNGTPGALAGTLAIGATTFAETPGTSLPALQGWAEVASTGRLGVLAVLEFGTGGTVTSQAATSGILSGSSLFVPFDNTQGNVTGLAVANTNQTQTLNISVVFQTEAGAQTSTAISLAPRGHATFILPSAFPAVAGARGSVHLTAASPDIAAVGLRFSGGLSFTSLGAFQ